MSNEQMVPPEKQVVFTSVDWSYTIRGSRLSRRINALACSCQSYDLAGRMKQQPDGSVRFHASAAQVAAWKAEAKQIGRSLDQIMRYHLVTGGEVQGPDDLILTMSFQPQETRGTGPER
jgi:hypothetical protein